MGVARIGTAPLSTPSGCKERLRSAAKNNQKLRVLTETIFKKRVVTTTQDN